ncbi:MAG: CBS domain-containing protein [Balneolaceae bacterium]|nr:MAG: CBS domain-containing protein [Balneolaceae bacterium]
MKVKQILKQKGGQVYTVDETTTVYDAIALMSEKDVGALLVMCRGVMCGIISERDYRNKVILKGRKSKDTAVRDIMTKDVKCVTGDYTLQDCMGIMSDKRIRHLPVLDDKNNLAGIISIGDIVKAIIDQQNSEIQNLREYITSSYPG